MQAKDPVCGMTVDTDQAPAKQEYQGVTYYFCGNGCAEMFAANPEQFLPEDHECHDHGDQGEDGGHEGHDCHDQGDGGEDGGHGDHHGGGHGGDHGDHDGHGGGHRPGQSDQK